MLEIICEAKDLKGLIRALEGSTGPYKDLKRLRLRAVQSPQGPHKALKCLRRPFKAF